MLEICDFPPVWSTGTGLGNSPTRVNDFLEVLHNVGLKSQVMNRGDRENGIK